MKLRLIAAESEEPEAAHKRLYDERRQRQERIEALGVNRAHLIGLPVLPWSAEAEAAEAGDYGLQALRAQATLSDKIHAYRRWFRNGG